MRGRGRLGWMVGLCILLGRVSVAWGQPTAPLPPVVSLPGGVTLIADIGLYRVTYRYRSGHGSAMPLGWIGHFDTATGISCTPFGTQAGKSAFLLHPPWRGGTGVTDQTFRLALPRAPHLALRFAIAMKQGEVGPGKSDGATFRVFLNDRTLLDKNKTDADWTSYELDLTPYAGQTITLRFETDPGPRDDPSFDYALWGDREIVAAGAPSASAHPTGFPLDLDALHETASYWGGDAPTWPAHRPDRPAFHIQVAQGEHAFLGGWSASVVPARPPASPPPAIGLGSGAYLELVAPDGSLVRSDSPGVHVTVAEQMLAAQNAYRRTLRYQIGTRTITVVTDLYTPHGYCVKAEVRSDDPYIATVCCGDVGPVAFRRQIPVPYLGSVTYLPDQGLFANALLDYTRSQASSQEGTTARYLPKTDGARNPVRETAYFVLAPDVRFAFPTPPNPPSPYRKLLGDKIVLDVWGGKFADNAAWLRELASYHLTHLATIAHDWQHGGYDNQLPNVLPAQEALGGDAGMKTWAQTATGLGELFALHENYVDFYPNAATYTEADVAHDSANHLVPAWKNLIQSYALAPTAILKYARQFTPDVHARYGTNASYLDVHSAVPPWFHVDFRADVPGAAEFQTVWNAHRDLWQLFRETHGGPVLGEGANHWYWSGLLDGVEAQFGVGVPGNGGETAPLFVDFDLMKIHPRQFNHGMGYLERWLSTGYQAGWESRIPTMKVLDQYRMQEIAYGHAGFVAAPLVRSLPFVWQEHNLVGPVAARYAMAQPVAIQYAVNDRLLDTSAAIAAGTAFDRVCVHYDNGLTVWANGRAAEWTVDKGPQVLTLPQFGWLALGKDLHAYTVLRDGVVVDYAETPTTLFANARATVVMPTARLLVMPTIAQFTQTGPRRFRIAFAWDVQEAIPEGEVPFIHVTGPGATEGEDIVFQLPAGSATPPAAWPVGQVTRGADFEFTLPPTVRDGPYEIKVGLYAPTTGERLFLTGPNGRDDGHRRIVVGTLHVSEGGKKLTLDRPDSTVPALTTADRQEREAHTNPTRKVIDFGKVSTDGSLLLERQRSGAWLLTPFPRTRPFTVTLDLRRLDPTLQPLRVSALDADGHTLGDIPVTFPTPSSTARAQFRVNTLPNAVRYLLSAQARTP